MNVHTALDDSQLSAFTLALDQARRAISDRRVMLAPAGPVEERRFDVSPRGRAS